MIYAPPSINLIRIGSALSPSVFREEKTIQMGLIWYLSVDLACSGALRKACLQGEVGQVRPCGTARTVGLCKQKVDAGGEEEEEHNSGKESLWEAGV